MSEEISFIHAADLHLDSPFKGLTDVPERIFKAILESTFGALDRLVEVAIEKKVDFVLLAGDLFDNEKQGLKAQIRLRKAFEKLKYHKIAVYASYGNHDYINGNIHPVTYPENVFIFDDEKVNHFTYNRNGHAIAQIYGFSYENRAVTANKSKDYIIADEAVPYHIAMLHGSLYSNTDHDVYAPFHINELAANSIDYWALGHIHKREILKAKPPIVYPGNIQGRNKKETGKKGCYHVVLSKTNSDIVFVPLQTIKFNNLSIDIASIEQPHQLELRIQQELENLADGTVPQLHALTLLSTNPMCIEWKNAGFIDDIIELINESIVHQNAWQYIYNHSIDFSETKSIDELEMGEHFIGELIRHFRQIEIHPFLEELYHHKEARKYLDILTNEESQSIKDEAEKLLVNELLKNVGGLN